MKLLPSVLVFLWPSLVGGRVLLLYTYEGKLSICKSEAGILLIESWVSLTTTCLMLPPPAACCFFSLLNMPIIFEAMRFILLGR